jgi:hypothetical protein
MVRDVALHLCASVPYQSTCASETSHFGIVTMSATWIRLFSSYKNLPNASWWCREQGRELGGEYQWLREYSYDVVQDDDHRTYVFRFGDNGVHYLDLSTKLVLQKRGKQTKGQANLQQEFPKPSKVWGCQSSLACVAVRVMGCRM